MQATTARSRCLLVVSHADCPPHRAVTQLNWENSYREGELGGLSTKWFPGLPLAIGDERPP
jgi:hypothetical protein